MGVLAVVAVVVLAAGCGGGSSSPSSPQVSMSGGIVPAVRSALVERLHEKGLGYRWIACLRNDRSFRGHQIVRCNVNFGDPHIEAYCIVLRDGKLYSDHNDARVLYQRDNRAPPATITTS